MSVRVMTAVWDIDLPDSEKIVLLALADCANDEGWCWPSMATLARKCSKTDRTVQASIKRLVECGHLTRIEVPGKGCKYRVHPRSGFTPEAASPPKVTTKTPEEISGHPRNGFGQTVKEPSRTVREARAGAPAATPPGEGKTGKVKPHPLPDGWAPPAIDDLPPMARDLVRKWPSGAYQASCETFRLHWQSETRAIGRKRDWLAALGKWLITDHPKVTRDAKAGVSFAQLAPVQPEAEAAPLNPVPEQALEGGLADGLRDALRKRMGHRLYDQWFASSAILVQADMITIVARGEFAADYIHRSFGSVLPAAIRDAGLNIDIVRTEPTGRRRGANNQQRSA